MKSGCMVSPVLAGAVVVTSGCVVVAAVDKGSVVVVSRLLPQAATTNTLDSSRLVWIDQLLRR